MADARFNFYADSSHEAFHFPAAHPSEVGALLIHGFMGSPKELRPLGEHLAANGVNAHGILLPGFGTQISRLATIKRAEWLEYRGRAVSRAANTLAAQWKALIELPLTIDVLAHELDFMRETLNGQRRAHRLNH